MKPAIVASTIGATASLFFSTAFPQGAKAEGADTGSEMTVIFRLPAIMRFYQHKDDTSSQMIFTENHGDSQILVGTGNIRPIRSASATFPISDEGWTLRLSQPLGTLLSDPEVHQIVEVDNNHNSSATLLTSKCRFDPTRSAESQGSTQPQGKDLPVGLLMTVPSICEVIRQVEGPLPEFAEAEEAQSKGFATTSNVATASGTIEPVFGGKDEL